MKKYLINFANGKYLEAQKSNSSSGIERGGFDEVIEYSIENVDNDFKNKNKDILSLSRGAGYWLWKPYFILKTLNTIKDGDIVFYSDSGSCFLRDASPLIQIASKEGSGLCCFNLGGIHKEAQWNKRITMQALGLDNEFIRFSSHRMASFVIAKKNVNSIAIIKEWLSFCEDINLLTDIATDVDNYPEFIEHRHDQSIWSLLTKKHAIKALPDPTEWGIRTQNGYTDDIKDFYILHHRQDVAKPLVDHLNDIQDSKYKELVSLALKFDGR